MKEKIIYGIQQIGVGVKDAGKAFNWYGKVLGADISVFDDDNIATFMAPYMGGSPHKKRAILSVNIQGGSCYEIWQYLDRTPTAPKEEVAIGDLGIYAAKIKAKNIEDAFVNIKSNGAKILCDIQKDPNNTPFFFIEDLYGNKIQIIESNNWYKKKKKYPTGGTIGCIIGVSNIDKARKLYSDILGYDKVIYDVTGKYNDIGFLKGGDREFRRILLTHSETRTGSLAPLFGDSQIELVELQNEQPNKIFANRYWGDIGFIHLCFDINGMQSLREECDKKGFPFTVDSVDSFKMGEAAGHWCYTEDPDGTLIEFVETHKIPLVQKWNWYLNLETRDPKKSLPNWLINALSFNRKKIK